MKKLFAILLTVAMLATMSVTAFAAESTTTDSGATINVKGTYTPDSPAFSEKISVDVSWEGMEFTYTGAGQGEWDPSIHDYTTIEGSWSTNKGTVTVTNHSNVAVKATLVFASDIEGLIKMIYSYSIKETKCLILV